MSQTTQNNPTAQSSPNTPNKLVKKAVIDRVPQLRAAATKIGLKMLPLQTEAACSRQGAEFTMVLAGCRGTGKSTFLNTLIGENLEDTSAPYVKGQVRSRRFTLVENKFDIKLTVVDMPDFGADMDNQYSWLPIIKHIEEQFRQYLIQEEQPVRNQIKDNRVHVCIYFIAPTNTPLNTLDIECMREIAQRVTLIPVIARSDTLNRDELNNFKAIINKTLKENDIDVYKHLRDTHVAEKLNAYSPYAIIGSNTVFKNSDGVLVRARKYGWGMVEVENPDHCDFVHIRELLMSENMLDLIDAMNLYYNSFRTEFLRSRIRSQRNLDGEELYNATNTNEDGMESYKMYSQFLTSKSKVNFEKYTGEDEALQKLVRSRLDGIKSFEENRLREWKKRIAVVASTQTQDLEEHQARVIALEKAILAMSPDERMQLKEISERAFKSGPPKIVSDQESIAGGSVIA